MRDKMSKIKTISNKVKPSTGVSRKIATPQDKEPVSRLQKANQEIYAAYIGKPFPEDKSRKTTAKRTLTKGTEPSRITQRPRTDDPTMLEYC
jgi:hypothetical protein